MHALAVAVRVYGLIMLAYHFYLDPVTRMVTNVALRLAAMATPSLELCRLGSLAGSGPLEPLWNLLVVPIIPGLSFTILSWAVSALQPWALRANIVRLRCRPRPTRTECPMLSPHHCPHRCRR